MSPLTILTYSPAAATTAPSVLTVPAMTTTTTTTPTAASASSMSRRRAGPSSRFGPLNLVFELIYLMREISRRERFRETSLTGDLCRVEATRFRSACMHEYAREE